MKKVTVLYGHPTNTEAFEHYYANTHLPLAAKMPHVSRVELTTFAAAPDGGKPAFHRMAEIYYPDAASMDASMASAEGQATVADLANFATGGVTVIIGDTNS